MNDEFEVEFEPSNDLLRRDVRTPLACEAAIAGVRVRFETNSRTVLDILSVCLNAEGVGSASQAVVRIMVVDEPDSPAALRRVCIDQERLLLATSGSLGISDARRAEALLYVTPALVRDRARFTAEFVLPLARGALGWPVE